MNETNIFAQVVQTVVPEPCFTKIFTDFNFFDVECAKIIISKCLGFAIILGSILVKLPQILKITKARSGEGISLMSVLLELTAISANASYGFRKEFPFSSYGEGVFLMIQTSLILFLVLFYGGNTVAAFLFLGVYGSIMAFLVSPAAPMSLLAGIQGINILIVIASKLIQAWANFRNGSTGQLSAATVVLIFLGSVARIFTSIQETGDTLIIATYLAASFFNGILVAQIIYYWEKKPKIE